MTAPSLPQPRAVTRAIPKPQRSLEKLYYGLWFNGKEFSNTWAMGNIPIWRRVLAPWRDAAINVLEIGSWEGRSALFFLNYLRRSRIVCIDTFGGGIDTAGDPALAAELPKIEGRFDRNLAPFASRVEKIKMSSSAALSDLADEERRFELIYIDGGHTYAEVMADSEQSWPMLVPGGVVIWDDYQWRLEHRPEDRPGAAIDAFLAAQEGQFRILAKGRQMIVQHLPG
jgi:hypothetical protein